MMMERMVMMMMMIKVMMMRMMVVVGMMMMMMMMRMMMMMMMMMKTMVVVVLALEVMVINAMTMKNDQHYSHDNPLQPLNHRPRHHLHRIREYHGWLRTRHAPHVTCHMSQATAIQLQLPNQNCNLKPQTPNPKTKHQP